MMRKGSAGLIRDAENYGFSEDVCTYVKCDVGMFLNGNEEIPANFRNLVEEYKQLVKRATGAPSGRPIAIPTCSARFSATITVPPPVAYAA